MVWRLSATYGKIRVPPDSLPKGIAMLTRFVVHFFVLIALTACAASYNEQNPPPSGQRDARAHPIYNVVDAPVITGSGKVPSLAQVETAIRNGATYKRWTVRPVAAGHVEASIHVRRHFAKVNITFSPRAYSIKYADSRVLLYDGTHIHRNYNKWIKLLERQINHNLMGF